MIKENALPTQTTLPSSWYLRMVSDTGMSKRIASSLVKWSIEDVTNLETILSGKQDLSTLKSMVAYLDATGQSVGSGFDMGTIANTTELDAVFCGLFTAPVPFAITNIGDVYGVLAISRNALGDDSTQDNTAASQLLFTSNGLYLRSYSTSWGLYRYVGGGVQPQPVTRAQLIDLMDDQELVQGTKYIITDHPNDMGIIVEAASSSQISQYALRLACQPKYYVAGSYMTGSGGTVEEYWNGVYELGTTPTQGEIYIYAGMVYKNLTGDDSTPPGEYILNSTDWELKTVEWGDYYSPNICEVIYKIGLTTSPVDEPCGVVQRQTDINNNTFGQALTGDPTLAQRTRIDYNDWGHPNIRNCELINCWANKEDCEFIGVRGYGQVYRNKTTNLASVRLTDDAVLIYDNASLTVFDCDISGNIYSNATVIVRYSDINAYVASNFSLTITDCEANSPITGNSSSNITSSYIFGTFRGNETCVVTNSTLNADFTNNTGTFDFIENKGLINNNRLTYASRINNVSEISGNTGIFSDVQTNDVDCPIKNNTSIKLSECRLIAASVGPHLGIQNCEDVEISSAEIWGGITSCRYCDFYNFKIESATAYITLCDYLNIDNSYLRGISWISKVSGTGYNELASSISGCAIDGELEELGAGYGSGTKFTLTDCVIGKSGDIKRSNGYVRETRLDGNITDVAVLAVDNSIIETQSDFDDYTSLTITDSYIGASVNANQQSSTPEVGSIIRSHIHAKTVLPDTFTITDSEISGTFDGATALRSVILSSSVTLDSKITDSIIHNSTVSRTITDSIVQDSTVNGTITNSRIFNSTARGEITNSEIHSSFAGTISNSIVEAGATIYAISLDCLNISNSRIGSRADIFKDDYGTLTITDCDFNGKYECNATSDNNETLTRCTVEYGAEILDTLNLTLEDCKLLYGAKLSLTEFYNKKLFNTIIDYDATSPVLYDLSRDTTLGGIGACSYIAGKLRVDTGTWNKGEFLTGTLQNILANGINVTKGTGLSLTVKSSGWYNIDYNASASANTMVLEFQCFIGANAIPQSYKKVKYVSGQHLNTSSRFMVYLTSGQTVDLKYKHDKGAYEDIIVANITITANKN